jgi:glycosyltransferase involved in cell wall biosynthesis
MLKVLMISNLPVNINQIRGGVDSAVINLLTGLSKLNIRLDVISFPANVQIKITTKFSKNISIHYIPTEILKNTLYNYLVYGRRTIKTIIDSFEPDIIHIQGTGPQLMLLKHKDHNNIVVTQHGIMKEEKKYQIGLKNKLKFGFKSIVESLYFTKIKNLIFISKYNKNLLHHNQIKMLTNTENIPNPINSKFFDVKSGAKRLNRIIFIGALNKRKGLINLLKAINLLTNKGVDFHLDVIGGYTNNSYKNIIDNYLSTNSIDSNIKFHGWQSQEYIRKMMSVNTIFVLPSYQETLPVSIAEAMAAGLVVIANNTGGIAEMIADNKTGFIFSDNNIDELSIILEKLYSNKKLIQLISKNAKLHAKQVYSSNNVAKTTYDFYQKVLNLN